MATLLLEIVDFLASEGLGTAGVDLFENFLPNDPDAAGVVKESGGSGPDMGFGSVGVQFENPTVQIIFRGAPEDYAGPRAKAQTAFNSMASISAPQSLGSTKYLLVIPLQQPFPLGGRDESKRWNIACNYLIKKEQS